MSNYVVSARKYRPTRFSEVVGQQHVTNTLKNALKSNQLAQALLFCGPRGVGKTTCARILAQVINCDEPSADFDACNSNENGALNENISSFSIFELDAASNNSVDDIRSLIEQVRFVPPEGKKKVYIIDEVHMLSSAAFNAFLKTLEEPPPYAIFILATTEKHKIIPTILSRCQIYDFSRIGVEPMVEHLKEIAQKENITADENGLHLIAQKADGALRDALSMFDRLLSFGEGAITYESTLENLNILDYDYYFNIVDSFLLQDVSAVLNQYHAIQQKGFEGDLFIHGLGEHFRNLLVARDENTHSLLEVSNDLKERYLNQAQIIDAGFLINALSTCNTADINYKAAKNKRLHVEMALIKLNYLNNLIDFDTNALVTETKKKRHNVEELKIQKPNSSNTVSQEKVPDSANQVLKEEIPSANNQAQKEVILNEDKQITVDQVQDSLSSNAAPAQTPNAEAQIVSNVSKPKDLVEEPTEAENKEEKVPLEKVQPVAEAQSLVENSSPSYKIQNTQSNAIILPNLAELEKKVVLEEAQKARQLAEKKVAAESNVLVTLNPEKVQQYLADYALLLKEQSKNVLGSLIASVQFSIKNQLVQMLVDSKVKAQQLNGVKEDLLLYLKKNLQEENVELKIGFVERTADTKPPVAYSPKERLQEMMQDNPAVKDLIEKLDLNFEY